MKVIQLLFAAAFTTACATSIKTLPENMNMGNQADAQLTVEGDLPSFSGATGWLNSQPLKRDDLRGKVVLVQFWTYTCINWQRTEPYVRAWYEKYSSRGLVVIGVHT